MKKTPSCIYNALSKQAFTLIEVTLALGVAGFCLVSIFGLLPIGINSNQVSLEQTVAGNIASSILSDLRSTPVTAPATSSHYGIPLPTPGKSTSTMGPSTSPATIFLAADGSAGASGELVTSGSAISRYRVTIGFAFPVPQVPQVGQCAATAVRVLVTWPALGSGPSGAWPTNFAGSYEANTTLDRN
jgi:type II secretory pathway pseudopilin PulG